MIRIVGADLVAQLLELDACITLMRDAFVMVAQGRVAQPLRQIVPTSDGSGMLGVMPAYIDEPTWLGVKAVSLFGENVARGLPSHQGAVLLLDASNGTPVALIEARTVTAIRTASATAAATDLLARKDAVTLGLIGTGEQSVMHAQALARIRPLAGILVHGRNAAKAEATARHIAIETGLSVQAATLEAAARCDILCTLTSARTPYLQADHLYEGQHINIVGFAGPGSAEVFPEVLGRGRYFADNSESVRRQAGEFLAACAAGISDEDGLAGSVGDVITGVVPGRSSDDEITIFRSLGMAVQDVLASSYILRAAEAKDLGDLVQF